MKMLIAAALVAISASAFAATELPHDYCGTLKDYGDSYQIKDGMYDVYFAQDDGAPADPNGIGKYLVSLQGAAVDKCYCITGIAESFDRAGKTAYSFKQVTSLKSCQDIVK